LKYAVHKFVLQLHDIMSLSMSKSMQNFMKRASPTQLPTLPSTLSKTSSHLQVKTHGQILALKIKLFHGKQALKFKIIYSYCIFCSM